MMENNTDRSKKIYALRNKLRNKTVEVARKKSRVLNQTQKSLNESNIPIVFAPKDIDTSVKKVNIQPERTVIRKARIKAEVRKYDQKASIETKEDHNFKDIVENNFINTSGLQNFALNLPKSSSLREVLLSEKDELTSQEFLAKLDIWMLLFNKTVG